MNGSTSPANPEIGQSILAGGYATNYHDIGSGPPLLLLHGSGPGVSGWANWRLAIMALSQTYRVIVPDLLGFGYTDPARDQKYSMAIWHDHLVAFMDALGVAKASVIGNSFGGALALRLAADSGHRVDKIVLNGPAGLNFPITDAVKAAWGYEPSVANMRALMELFAYDSSLISDDLAKLRYEASIRGHVPHSFRAMFMPPRQEMLEDLSTDPAKLRDLPHRTLIVHGREDLFVPLTSSIELNSLIKNSDLYVFGCCGHWVQVEQAERFNSVVMEFLAT